MHPSYMWMYVCYIHIWCPSFYTIINLRSVIMSNLDYATWLQNSNEGGDFIVFYFLREPPAQLTEVRFASFLSGGFTTMTVINPPEKKLAKRTSVQLPNLVQPCSPPARPTPSSKQARARDDDVIFHRDPLLHMY